jgi:hypothetical protein
MLANGFAGKQLPITALTLLMRDGRPVYQAVGGLGAESLLIDAETGTVKYAPPPGVLTRYFRQAHFITSPEAGKYFYSRRCRRSPRSRLSPAFI